MQKLQPAVVMETKKAQTSVLGKKQVKQLELHLNFILFPCLLAEHLHHILYYLEWTFTCLYSLHIIFPTFILQLITSWWIMKCRSLKLFLASDLDTWWKSDCWMYNIIFWIAAFFFCALLSRCPFTVANLSLCSWLTHKLWSVCRPILITLITHIQPRHHDVLSLW